MAVVYLKQRKLAEAERAAKEEARHNQSSVVGLLLVALERGNGAAANQFEKVLESRFLTDRGARASLRQLFLCRGYLDLKSGRGGEAIENFKQALNHRPLIWDIDSLEDCLANAYLELGRFDEAIAEYERILKLNPNYPLALYHLGQAYDRKGEPDQARASYERFLQVWKDADANVPEVVAAKKRLLS